MKNFYLFLAGGIILITAILFFIPSNAPLHPEKKLTEKEETEDRMDLAMQQDFELTKDLKLNDVPRERLINAMDIKTQRISAAAFKDVAVTGINWQERGPNNVGGRTRALLFDLNDAANGYKKVWAGSVGGGLWYTNDITAASPSWNKVNDLFENIAVTAITQNPLNPQEMYFGTGEGWYNFDAARGLGIWKSSDGGANWTRLNSTLSFKYVNDLLIDKNGNLYAAVKQQYLADGYGIQKSIDGGATWTSVLGLYAGNPLPGGDLELAANGDVYATLGASGRTGVVYRSDYAVNNTTTGDVGTWTDISPAGTSAFRVELACAPSNSNIVYALFQSATSGDCGSIQRYDASTNTWTTKTVPTIVDQGDNSNFTRGQAWYDLIAAVDPNDENVLYIGGVDALRSDDAGVTWTQMTTWSLYNAPAFTSAQNVHADHHAIIYSPGSSSIAIWGTDGGVAYTSNANVTGSKPTFFNKDLGYNVTQYYSAAIHPTNPNYFLAGSQDNGTQKYTAAGINSTTSASDGDGGFCFIDQLNPNIQITSTVYNNYFISTNGGNTFSGRYFNNYGSFINPAAYDAQSKKLYAANLVNAFSSINTFLRWEDPATGGSATSFVTVPQFNGSKVTNVTVSPLTPNRVLFGLQSGAIVSVDNANTGSSINGTVIGNLGASISSISIDPANEDHILATLSNYGSALVEECKNATQASPTWTITKGNLPDMPVRWAMFDPRNADWALLATELGVWSTDDLNGASTDWQPTNSGLANVRIDMLQYRPGDRTIAAATHGRGLFTAVVPNVTTPDINFVTASASGVEKTTGTSGCRNYTDYTFQLSIANAPTGDATVTLNVQGSSTATIGNDFDFTTNGNFSSPSSTLIFANGATASKTVTLRIYDDAEIEPTENIKIGYNITGTTDAQKGVGFQTYTFTIVDNDFAPVGDGSGMFSSGNANVGGYLFCPFRTDKLKHRLQTIYTASELKAAGFSGSGNITDLQLYVTSPNARLFNGFTISMANSPAPNLNYGFITDLFTQVYTGDYTTLPAGQFNSPTANNFTFSSPFLWDGVSNIVIQFCFDGGPDLAGTQYTVESNFAPLGTGVKTSVFSDYTNEAVAGCSLPDAVDNDNRVKITFNASFAGTTIATTLNTSRTENFAGNNDLYFYSATGEILARVKNTGTSNYGCTQVVTDRAGTGATKFWNNNPPNYLMDKTFRILPSTNDPAGTYQATFYFTKAEVDGWEAATGQTFSNIQMVKVPGQISTTTPSNQEPGGVGTTQIVTPVVANLGTKYSLTATFNNGFSGFGFGIPGTGTTLPITLLDFSGSLQYDHSVLQWTTSSEINSKQFELEKSFDGKNFTKIGIIKAAGNSVSNRKYSLLDKQAASGINYYRLLMIDKDGQTKISNVVVIKNVSAKQNVHVLNNPFRNNILIRFERIPAGKVSLQLTDLSGKKITSREINAIPMQVYQWDIGQLPISHGIYILTAGVDRKKYVIQLMRE